MHTPSRAAHWPLILTGLAIILGPALMWVALFDWNNFFDKSYKARWLAKLLGKTGTRIFYLLIGALVFVCGIVKLYDLFSHGW